MPEDNSNNQIDWTIYAKKTGLVMTLVQWLRLSVEITGAGAIGVGSIISLFRFVKALIVGKETDFNAIHLT